ncbi:MAG: LacI family DNA-binding transcriptional regulator [Spirochaetes bacterium]|nr:LacI family DNA-binding transcriptional regulator [Spirochaetota bacterium]
MPKVAKTNINTIAKMAGVSTTTVSNFINGTETLPISEEKRARIMQSMRRLKYRPSFASSQLRRRTLLPGKVVFFFGSHPQQNPFRTVRNPMLGELIVVLEQKVREQLRLALVVRHVGDEDLQADWNETLSDAEGVICYGQLDRALHDSCLRRNLPLALISDNPQIATRGLSELPSVDCVFFDAASHLQILFDHLRGLGAKRFVFVSSWNIERNHPKGFALEAEAKVRRFRELMDAHRDIGGELLFPPMPENGDPLFEARNAFDFLGRHQAALRAADAFIGHNDFVAQGIIAALRAEGRTPGPGALVCGEGDYPECRHSIPAMTTATYDQEFLSNSVCEVLSRRIKDNRPRDERILIPSRLIQRETTGSVLA